MSQAIPANIDPALIGGTALATILNDFKDAIASGFSGTTRPANLQAGGYWVDTTNEDTPNFYWMVKIYTGSDDVEIFRVNISTGLPTISGTADTFTIARTSDDNVGPILRLVKNRIADDGQVLSGDVMAEMRIIGLADDASEPVTVLMKVVAAEDQTATAAGGYLRLDVIPTGTVSAVEAVRIGDVIESKIRHKLNSLELGSQNVATTATIAQLSATKTLVEMTGSTATDIQGINSASTMTKVITIHNRSSANVTLKHLNGTASAADRMKLPGGIDVILVPENSVELFYCTTDTYWKVKSGASSQAAVAYPVVSTAATTKATTINWATGLTQKVSLQANTIISFSNPVEGAVHTLLVSQDTAVSAPWMYNFNMPTQDPRRGNFQPKGVLAVGNTDVYKWMYSTGIKPAVTEANSEIAFAPTAPATLITGLDLSPDGKTLLGGQTSSPYSVAWEITESLVDDLTPFGLKNITTPAALAAQALGIAYAKDNKSVFTVGGTTPYAQGWNTNRGIPTTVFGNNADLPAGAGKCIAFSPDGLAIAVGHATTPYISTYPYIGNFAAGKSTDPGTLPPGTVTGVAFSPQSDFLTIVSKTTPYIRTWAFSTPFSAHAFGAVVSNPGVLPADGPTGLVGRQVAWRPQGDFIAMCMDTTPYIYVVPFNRTTAAYGAPLTVTNVPAGAATSIAWTPCGQFLLVGCDTSPYFYIYDFSSSLLDTNVTLSGAALSNQVNDIVVHPHGEIAFLALNGGIFITHFTLPNKARSYVRLEPLGI